VLDAEALHEVKERYFTAMAAEIQRHDGKIEKYIGDAIMAVFGLPRAHEDDALRAVRATAGMQAALATLNEDLQARYGVTLANRTGVNTGSVVANDDPTADQKLATGDAVNVAARLEQAAPENQVYLGEVTYRLVRDAVEVEPVEPLELRLTTTAPTDAAAGTAVAGGSYAPQPIAIDPATGNATALGTQVIFGNMPAVGGGGVVGWEIWDAAGFRWWHGTWDVAYTVAAGQDYVVDAGDLDLTVD
jgi:hypothetical protein